MKIEYDKNNVWDPLKEETMTDFRKLTLLHSNDMHGDFLSKDQDDALVGGVSMLSGYVAKTREEEESVLYCIAGDMLQGSLIDSEYKGISTMEIMNFIAPDIACIGNHEVDYGLPHLLFLEKYAKFPIISANLYLKNTGTRLLDAHKIIEIDGIKVLFIGILTESILDSLKKDQFISGLVDIREAAGEVTKICDSYKTTDIDLTVVLTHIGFENDCALAQMLDPSTGVDLIIGGHSHTILREPADINGILITQAGVGTQQIGRFDLIIDKDHNSIYDYTWNLIPINEATCPKDDVLEKVIYRYKNQIDEKYGRILTHLGRKLTHPARTQETEIGNLFADIAQSMLDLDLMLLGSGALRKPEMGPVVTLSDLITMLPFAEGVLMIKVSGAQLRTAFEHVLLPERCDSTFEHYQVSKGTQVVYDQTARKVVSLTINGTVMDEARLYRVGLQPFHLNNLEKFLNLDPAVIQAQAQPITVCSSLINVIEEAFMTQTNLKAKVEGRLQRINLPQGDTHV